MKVRMKVGISGGRADGTEWPPAGGVLEVEAREGAELCAAHLAEPVVEERQAETRPAPEDVEKRKALTSPPPVLTAKPATPAPETAPPKRTTAKGTS